MLSKTLRDAIKDKAARMRLYDFLLYHYYRDPPPWGSQARQHQSLLARELYEHKIDKFRRLR